jgi:hypothetical protein
MVSSSLVSPSIPRSQWLHERAYSAWGLATTLWRQSQENRMGRQDLTFKTVSQPSLLVGMPWPRSSSEGQRHLRPASRDTNRCRLTVAGCAACRDYR